MNLSDIMVKTLPIAVRTAIRASILNNEPLDEIATRYQCSIQTVRHHKRSIKSLVETGVDLRKKAGRKRKISVGLFEVSVACTSQDLAVYEPKCIANNSS